MGIVGRRHGHVARGQTGGGGGGVDLVVWRAEATVSMDEARSYLEMPMKKHAGKTLGMVLEIDQSLSHARAAHLQRGSGHLLPLDRLCPFERVKTVFDSIEPLWFVVQQAALVIQQASSNLCRPRLPCSSRRKSEACHGMSHGVSSLLVHDTPVALATSLGAIGCAVGISASPEALAVAGTCIKEEEFEPLRRRSCSPFVGKWRIWALWAW